MLKEYNESIPVDKAAYSSDSRNKSSNKSSINDNDRSIIGGALYVYTASHKEDSDKYDISPALPPSKKKFQTKKNSAY